MYHHSVILNRIHVADAFIINSYMPRLCCYVAFELLLYKCENAHGKNKKINRETNCVRVVIKCVKFNNKILPVTFTFRNTIRNKY